MTNPFQIELIINQLREISGPAEIPWQVFAEMKAVCDYRIIQPLINLFWEYSASGETIEAAQQILVDFGSAAVPALIKALESSDMETRYLATITLGLIADPLAIEPLTRRFGDEEHDVSIEAGTALSKIGEKALPFILTALTDTDATTRAYALGALHYFNGSEVNEAILEGLSDENIRVVLAAVGAAGRPAFFEATEPLKKLLEENPPFKFAAKSSLDFDLVKRAAAKSLGIIGDPRAIDALTPLLADKDNYLAEAAAVALGLIGDVRAIEPLTCALAIVDNKSVQHYISRALTRYGDAARPAIRAALKDPAANTRFGAAMVLGNIGDENDLVLLEPLAESDEAETFSRAKVKTAAREAIKRIKEKT